MSQVKSVLLAVLLFLFPLFFLPTTQEFFVTNKLFLLAFGVLVLLVLSTNGVVTTRKIAWKKTSFDNLLLLFLVATSVSVVLSAPNKIEALLNPAFGLVALFSLTLLYFYLSRETSMRQYNHITILNYSAFVLSLVAIFFFFQPFRNLAVPQEFQFLRNVAFTPLGNRLDLALFLGFFVLYGLSQLFVAKKHAPFLYVALFFNTVALALTTYRIFQPETAQLALLLPPYTISWYSAVEILKNPLTAIFGVGPDNFTAVFTRVKDFAYNRSIFWNIGSFVVSRSAVLQIFTETGLLGLLAFGLLLAVAARKVKEKIGHHYGTLLILSSYVLFILVFFPPSLPVFFLFFVTLSAISATDQDGAVEVNLSTMTPVVWGVAVVSFVFVVGSSYFLGRAYAAEYFFRRSFLGLLKNNAREFYENQRQAVRMNPYIERYRLNFSQTNLFIANNIARRAQQRGKEGKPGQLTDQERQTVTQAIQTAISEAKAAVALNPQKAGNWDNLARVYRSIINAARGADVWTVSSYQRAIVLDPRNPIYRLNLGGTFYSLGNYDDSIGIFEQTVGLKPDWANAHYNLAWAYYQKADYQRATRSMQNVLQLLEARKDTQDYKRASSELEEFKKKLPKEPEGSTGSGQLQLPQQPQPVIRPPLQLPQNASPEAR